MEPLYTLITIVLSAMGVLIAYLQYKRTSKPVRDNIQLSAEEEVQSIEANGAALPGFVIRFVEPVCYFDCSALEHHGITSSEVFDWNTFSFKWKRDAPESYFSSTVVILNRTSEPLYISRIRCSVSRIGINRASRAAQTYIMFHPCSQMRILEKHTDREIVLEPWYRIDSKQKTLWDLRLDLGVVPPFEKGDSYIEGLEIEFTCDSGIYIGKLRFDDKGVRRRCS
jgi:hypothetical protein